MSLARLWFRQGRSAEAFERLATTYGKFTEGFASGDLVQARAMMREMSSEGRFEKWSLGWGGRGNPFLGVWRSV